MTGLQFKDLRRGSKSLVLRIAMSAAITAASIVSSHDARAGQCLADLKNVTLADGKALKLRDYLCRSDDGGNAKLRVQFHRMSDIGGNALIVDSMNESLRKVVGSGRVADTAPGRAFSTLLDKFATDDVLNYNAVDFSVGTPVAGQGMGPNERPWEKIKPGTIRGLFDNGGEAVPDFPQPEALLEVQKHKALPKGYQRASNDTIWRYMTPSDLAGFEQGLRRLNRLAGRKNPDGDIGSSPWILRQIAFARYITASNFPDDLFILVGSNETGGCGNEWMFGFIPRNLLLETAIVENISSKPVQISAFLGAARDDRALRPANQGLQTTLESTTKLPISADTLRPGERLAIPLRMLLINGPPLKRLFENARTRPRNTNYIWGPELALKSLVADGETFRLDGASANFLSLTTSCECGSCPYLHSWNARDRSWHSHGKVIHTAKDKSRETTESVPLEAFTERFRLSELEAEVAFIDHVQQRVKLSDGREIVLSPVAAPEIDRRDGRYLSLYWGETREFTFKLPDAVGQTQVKSATIEVTGYYVRYSDIIARRYPSPLSRLHVLPVKNN